MKARKIDPESYASPYAKHVISVCFDKRSLSLIQPGLKLLYAPDDPPLFIAINDVDESYDYQ